MLRDDPHFQNLAAQVAAQAALVDALAAALLPQAADPAHCRAIFAQAAAMAEAPGPRGRLDDVAAAFMADVRVRAAPMLRASLAVLDELLDAPKPVAAPSDDGA